MLRQIKNFVGALKGSGSCPNCGDSWCWKSYDSVEYEENCGVASGVMICKECLNHPEKLNLQKILKDLKDYGWEEKNLRLVESALFLKINSVVIPRNWVTLLKRGWKIQLTSCGCGGSHAWLDPSGRMYGCICHNTPPIEPIEPSNRKEFDMLFESITGIHPDNAQVGDDGFLFVPPSSNLEEKSIEQRTRISELAGPNGWRNHIVNDEYAGWWIKRPI